MDVRPENPLIVQSDHTVLMEVDGPLYPAARDGLAAFAELVKSPEHIHTYRVTPLSIWNAAAAGHGPAEMAETLTKFAKYPVPQNVLRDIEDYASRYGRDPPSPRRRDARSWRATTSCLMKRGGGEQPRRLQVRAGQARFARRFSVDPAMRGHVKQAMIKPRLPGRGSRRLRRGWPARHRAG